ncbi:MAG: methylmalonyl-CoA mutase [Saprospiraceae bacterium]|jgi:methylmalonyl-CoA mutase
MSSINLFKEFDKVSKEEWLAKILTDRKGGDVVEDLDWSFEGINTTPFYHSEDLTSENPHLGLNKSNNSWQIGERIVASKPVDSNRIILDALGQGASAINIDLTITQEEDIKRIFSEVQHEWISTHLNLRNIDNPLQGIKSFCSVVKSKGQNNSVIKGSIDISIDDSSYKGLLKDIFSLLPLFRVKISSLEIEDESSVEVLVSILTKTYSLFQLGQENRIGLDVLFSKLQYAITVRDNYYRNIVLLRSIRLLVSQLCSIYNVEDEPSIIIETWLKESDQSNDANYNLIKNTSQILGAVIGGGDIIYPMTYSESMQEETHNHRISRNINHVLQLESYMDRVVDPAAGSYFFESMTDRLCKKAWGEFQNRV